MFGPHRAQAQRSAKPLEVRLLIQGVRTNRPLSQGRGSTRWLCGSSLGWSPAGFVGFVRTSGGVRSAVRGSDRTGQGKEVGSMRIIAREWERVVLLRDGRVEQVLQPGRHRVRSRRLEPERIDVRERQYAVAGQEILTSDSVVVKLSAIVVWQVADPARFLTVAEHPLSRLHVAVQQAMRVRVAARDLESLLTQRDEVVAGVVDEIAPELAGLGIAVRLGRRARPDAAGRDPPRRQRGAARAGAGSGRPGARPLRGGCAALAGQHGAAARGAPGPAAPAHAAGGRSRREAGPQDRHAGQRTVPTGTSDPHGPGWASGTVRRYRSGWLRPGRPGGGPGSPARRRSWRTRSSSTIDPCPASNR